MNARIARDLPAELDHATPDALAAARAPRLLTAPEAAELLRIRESTLRDYGRRGIVPCIRIGRHVRFLESDLIAAIEQFRSAA